MRYTNGGLREKLLAAVGTSEDHAHGLWATVFFWFKKNAHFNAIWIIYYAFLLLESLKKQSCKNPNLIDNIKFNIKFPNPINPLYYLQVEFKNMFKL